MRDFLGREAELAALERSYRSRTGAMVPIYGRRRVGKTELIKRFVADKPGAVYVVGEHAPAGLQLRAFLTAAGQALATPLLEQVSPSSWRDALVMVEEAWKGPGKLVIVLDEFQWLCESSPELPSVLQHLWDQRWRDSGRVMIILCGSFIGFMEREVLGAKAPLFGRRTAQILLRPFGYREAALFHPSYSLVDRAKAYFICGGIPRYLELFEPSRSIDMNIVACFLDEYSPLFREADFLLREELRDLQTYHAILVALAERPMALTEVGAVTGQGHNVQYHLQQLAGLGYVTRRFPLAGTRPNKQSVRWTLDDPLLRFWFRFVSPNQSLLQVPGPGPTFAGRIRPALDAYFGRCFEALCREALPWIYARERLTAAYDIGEYWSRDTQIDVVGMRDDGWIDLGECKWGAVRSRPAVERELEDRVEHFPNPRNATIQRRVFVRTLASGARRDEAGVRWHDLADLYR